jgi:hypothetical protein
MELLALLQPRVDHRAIGRLAVAILERREILEHCANVRLGDRSRCAVVGELVETVDPVAIACLSRFAFVRLSIAAVVERSDVECLKWR